MTAHDARPVLVYDGHCAFCIAQAARLARWTGDRAVLESFREPGAIARHPGLDAAACAEALQLVLPDGRIVSGAEAVAQALRLRPALAPLGWLYHLPGIRHLADAGYRLVARNRFRLRGAVCTDESCGRHQAREPPPGQALVRTLFLRCLGLILVCAFGSLYLQMDVLYGSRGLLPACRPEAVSGPTLFAVFCDDRLLRAVPLAGALLGMLLVLDLAPRWCLAGAWVLYLSLVNVGQTFLQFQWDNLVLETTFLAFFVAPGGVRRLAASPRPLGVFLLRWLVFRLHVESGAAKLLLGDPSWWNLTAMATYWETAPLPTWIGWWAHQLPLTAQKGLSLSTCLVELGLPWLIWGPRRLRPVAFAGMVAFQVGVLLTGNYGIFNYLTIALCLVVLDDGHLGRSAPAARPWGLPSAVAAGALAVLFVVPFLPFVPSLRAVYQQLQPVPQLLGRVRTANAYHLFAQMTYVRREAVIEGSDDGVGWRPYEFAYKPGDPDRAPSFVAPHQPRVDFQLWFLLLHGRRSAPYFNALLARLGGDPAAVTPLFTRDPFPTTPPRFLRVAGYRYRFTDRATRQATGAWWQRTLEWTSPPIAPGTVR